MNRVIFTAARKDNGKIVKGYYLCLHNQKPSGNDLHIIVDECGEYHPIDSRTLKWEVVKLVNADGTPMIWEEE